MILPLLTHLGETTNDKDLKKEIELAIQAFKQEYGKVFLITNTIVSTGIFKEGLIINELLENFIEAGKRKDFKSIVVDPKILKLFPKAQVTKKVSSVARLIEVKDRFTLGKVIDTCKKLNVYTEYDILEAIEFAIALVDADKIDNDNYGIAIFLNNNHGETSYRLDVWRDRLGSLRLNINERSGRLWDTLEAGSSVLVN